MPNDPLSEARYRHFMEMERRKQLLHQAKEVPLEHKVNLKFGWVFVALVALAIPTTLVLLNQAQDLRQSAAPTEEIVKAVNGEGITAAELDEKLRELLGSDYRTSSLAAQTRQVALEQLTREKIIQQEARKRGISVNENEIETSPLKSDNPLSRKLIYNQLLEEKIKEKVVSWKLVDYAVAFDENQGVFIKASLEKLQSEAKKGKSIKEAYDSLKENSDFYGKMRIIESEKVFEAGSWDPIYSEQLFKYKKGDVTNIIEGNASYRIAVLKDENVTRFKNFEEWFSQLPI